MRIRSIIILVIFLFSFLHSLRASDSVDSLINALQSAHDTSKAKISNAIAFKYRTIDPNQTIIYAQRALKIAKDNKHLQEIQNAYSILGLGYRYIGRFDSAMYFQQLALQIAIEMNNESIQAIEYNRIGLIYKKMGELSNAIDYFFKSTDIVKKIGSENRLANLYNNIGNIYRQRGFYDIALEYYVNTLKIRNKLTDAEGLAYIYNNIGNLYADLNQPATAIQYQKRSLKIKKEINDQVGVIISYLNIGNIYILPSIHKPDSALYYCQLALNMASKLSLTDEIISIYNSMGKTYLSINNPRQALIYFRDALAMIDQTVGSDELINSYNHIGTAQFKLHQYDSAIYYLNKAYILARNEDVITEVADIYNKLSMVYLEMNDSRKALSYIQKYNDVNDSLFNEKVSHNITELLINFETEEQEKTNQILQQKNHIQALEIKKKTQLLYFAILTVTLILAISIILFYAYHLKRKAHQQLSYQKNLIQQSEKELKLANATKDRFFSIIAHDLINPFNAILGFTNLLISDFDQFNKEEKLSFIKNIKESAEKTSQLLENLLEWARTTTAEIKFSPKEFSLDLLVQETISLLYPIAKNKSIEIINNIPDQFTMVADQHMINTIIRNLITNAIKFSYPNTTITVSSSRNGKNTIITISDKGMGMDESQINALFEIDRNFQMEGTAHEKGTGLGLILSKEFIKKHQGEIFVNSKPGFGTDISFSIPRLKK